MTEADLKRRKEEDRQLAEAIRDALPDGPAGYQNEAGRDDLEYETSLHIPLWRSRRTGQVVAMSHTAAMVRRLFQVHRRTHIVDGKHGNDRETLGSPGVHFGKLAMLVGLVLGGPAGALAGKVAEALEDGKIDADDIGRLLGAKKDGDAR